ncbi:MAG: chemotaxis protein [Verrucomicrobia bacterium]|nr:chemotaxis protein [Verrucomicrobiota bacterium]MCH8512989.1 chemotaxis protein [Kiritimatiellia bacterium]
MITKLILSIGIIFAAFLFWVIIQESARRFARRHPEFGPAREEGGECGVSCGCPNWKKCRDRKNQQQATNNRQLTTSNQQHQTPPKP